MALGCSNVHTCSQKDSHKSYESLPLKINLRLHKLRKYTSCDLANTVYKQTIIPLFDYADFLIESGQNKYITHLNDLHVKGLRIDNR